MKLIWFIFAINLYGCLSILNAENIIESAQDSTASDLIFPMKQTSFADSVILYDAGAMGENTGGEPDTSRQHFKHVLGSPDDQSVCLGSGGTLVIQFIDNILIDGPGPDLCIFQTDTLHEELQVWISNDGLVYYPAGKTFSAISYLDIHNVAAPHKIYNYVKIRDNADQGVNSGFCLGGDIDAVGAIHTAKKIEISLNLVFTGLNTTWTQDAFHVLDGHVTEFKEFENTNLMIFTHTETNGTHDFNRIISQQRAGAIRNYLIDIHNFNENQIKAVGLGNKYPVTTQTDSLSQLINKRIEFYIYPDHLYFPILRP